MSIFLTDLSIILGLFLTCIDIVQNSYTRFYINKLFSFNKYVLTIY